LLFDKKKPVNDDKYPEYKLNFNIVVKYSRRSFSLSSIPHTDKYLTINDVLMPKELDADWILTHSGYLASYSTELKYL